MNVPSSDNNVSSMRELTHEALVDLLTVLESAHRSVVVTITTEYGQGRLWTRAGKLVDAEFGSLAGRPALYKLLNLSHGTFSIQSDVSHPIAFSEAPSEVLASLSRRAEEWQRLLNTGLALDAALEFDPKRLDTLKQKPTKDELRLLSLFDGSRMLVEAIDQSGLDAVAALSVVHGFIEAGLLDAPPHSMDDAPPTLNQFPTGEPGEKSGVVEPEARKRAERQPSPSTSAPPSRERISSEPVIEAKTLAVYETVALTPPPDASPAGGDVGASRVRTLMGSPKPSNNPIRPAALKSVGIRAANDDARVPSAPPVAPSPAPGEPAANATLEPTTNPDQASNPAGAVRLGRYEVLCCIKRGGMGSVYLARAQGAAGFRRLFALKVINQRLSGERDASELFFHEARLCGRLHHPNVVNIVDLAADGNQPYLVMDYVEGCSFDDLLIRHPSHRPARLVIPIVLDLLNGLHAAHRLSDDHGAPLGLVHCDVSPHNMLLGVDGACRLTDFGVARSRERAEDGQTRGKPGYLSPEQISSKHIDHRSDVFSVGVVLYNALTGTHLFRGRTTEETLHNVLHQRVVPPSQVGLKPSPAYDWVCMTALNRAPDERFQSAEEMLTELRRVALAEQALAPASEVAAWVYSSFGEELQLRRLASLDGLRSGKGRAPGDPSRATGKVARPEPEAASEQLEKTHSTVARAKQSFGQLLAAGGEESESRTVLLADPPQRRSKILYVALGLMALAVVLTVLFPDVVARAFTMTPTRDSELPEEAPMPEIQINPAPEQPPGEAPTAEPAKSTAGSAPAGSPQ